MRPMNDKGWMAMTGRDRLNPSRLRNRFRAVRQAAAAALEALARRGGAAVVRTGETPAPPGGMFVRRFAPWRAALLVLAAALLVGCQQSVRVTEGTAPRRYPYDAEILGTIDMQVFRDATEIEIANHTATTWENFDLWLNERYVRHIERLPAGETMRLSLYEFVDEYGEGLEAGGFLSTGRPDPIVKVEIQTADGLIGLIAIPEKRPVE